MNLENSIAHDFIQHGECDAAMLDSWKTAMVFIHSKINANLIAYGFVDKMKAARIVLSAAETMPPVTAINPHP